MGSDPLADDLARMKAAPSSGDPLEDDLIAKGLRKRTQAQWEASPEYAKLKAKHEKTVGQNMQLREESGFNPETDDPASRTKALTADPLTAGEAGRSFASGVGTMFEDEANAASLGLYGRARDTIGEKFDPEGRRAAKAEMAKNREMPGWGAISAVGQAGASGLGAPGKIAQGAAALTNAASGAARPVLAGALAGGATGALQAGVDSAGRDDATGTLKRMAIGGGVGAGVGAGAGLIGKYVGGAPERKAESELAGLREGVQNKTRVQKFQPNEENFRAALEKEPKLRDLAKVDPQTAQPAFHQKVEEKANTLLNPFYEQMAQTGRDGVPIQTITKQLQAARAGFNKFTDKPAIALADQMIQDMTEHAAQNNGTVPAQLVRETATAFGRSGHSNLPMFGPIPITKEVKQDISGALRESIADHVESLAGNTASGKALRGAYEAANNEVSTWIKMRDIVDEKARRAAGNAVPMADLIPQAVHAIKHPYLTAGKLLMGKAPDVIDRRILGPAVASRPAQAMAPLGTALQRGAAPVTGNMLVQAAREKRRREEEMAARLTGRTP